MDNPCCSCTLTVGRCGAVDAGMLSGDAAVRFGAVGGAFLSGGRCVLSGGRCALSRLRGDKQPPTITCEVELIKRRLGVGQRVVDVPELAHHVAAAGERAGAAGSRAGGCKRLRSAAGHCRPGCSGWRAARAQERLDHPDRRLDLGRLLEEMRVARQQPTVLGLLSDRKVNTRAARRRGGRQPHGTRAAQPPRRCVAAKVCAADLVEEKDKREQHHRRELVQLLVLLLEPTHIPPRNGPVSAPAARAPAPVRRHRPAVVRCVWGVRCVCVCGSTGDKCSRRTGRPWRSPHRTSTGP